MYAGKSNPTLGNQYATANSNGGLLVFISAEPVNKNYDLLEEVKMNDMFEIAEAGKDESGKGKFWRKLWDIGTNAYQNISFLERINKFCMEARNQYPNADALIFNTNYKSASVVKFKEN
ncbi:MAG: hypothetical protein HY063_14070 [Bacteroidetes bacterium]|nr:hypothetical protein [Bacteroidota bacterium]